MTGDYNTAAGYAVSYWNATSAAGQFVFATSGANVVMQQYTSEQDYWALTTNGNCTSGTYQTFLIVALNSAANQMGALSLYQKRIVIEHELGHVYGLCHPDACLNGNPKSTCQTNPMAVMWQGTGKFSCAGPAPWADDVAGVNAIY